MGHHVSLIPYSLFPVSPVRVMYSRAVAYVVYGPGQRHKVPGAATNADCVVPSKVLFELDTRIMYVFQVN